jgi:hypothetical protein
MRWRSLIPSISSRAEVDHFPIPGEPDRVPSRGLSTGRMFSVPFGSRTLNHIGAPSRPPPITPAHGPPAWDEGVEPLPDWDALAQPEPEYQFDQSVEW